MKLSRSTSWRLRQADSNFLHLALFARDAAGLPVKPAAHIPPSLARELAGRSEITDAGQRTAAAIQWADWWVGSSRTLRMKRSGRKANWATKLWSAFD